MLHTIIYKIKNKDLLYSTWNYIYFVLIYNGKEQEQECESLCCTPETNTMLQINYTSNFKRLRKRDTEICDTKKKITIFGIFLLKFVMNSIQFVKQLHREKNSGLILSPSAKVKVKVVQSCPTLCNPMDYTVHGISRPEYWSGQPFPSLVAQPVKNLPAMQQTWVQSLGQEESLC